MLVHDGQTNNTMYQHVLQPVNITWKVLCNAFVGVHGQW